MRRYPFFAQALYSIVPGVLFPLAVVIPAFVSSTPARATCPNLNSTYTKSPPPKVIKYYKPGPAGCGMAVCSGTGVTGYTLNSPPLRTFVATNNHTIAKAKCSWKCSTCTVVIDGSDGLPVELMDFSIE
jgi:hypothetical protein